jgi:hypothetical protein
VVIPLPPGVSAFVDPDDEPIISILEQCAEERRRLGLPSYSRDDLERLFQVLNAPAPERPLPANVIPIAAARRPGRPPKPRR